VESVVEQRNGRIDRKLQPAETLTCRYFAYAQRPEDVVLEALVRKTETITSQLGSAGQVLGERIHAAGENFTHLKVAPLAEELPLDFGKLAEVDAIGISLGFLLLRKPIENLAGGFVRLEGLAVPLDGSEDGVLFVVRASGQNLAPTFMHDFPRPGALPIVVDGEVIGSMGVSSADGEKCAQAAIDAVFKKQGTPPAP
jgi:hypothetical protein